jgi:hypothetical protein
MAIGGVKSEYTISVIELPLIPKMACPLSQHSVRPEIGKKGQNRGCDRVRDIGRDRWETEIITIL